MESFTWFSLHQETSENKLKRCSYQKSCPCLLSKFYSSCRHWCQSRTWLLEIKSLKRESWQASSWDVIVIEMETVLSKSYERSFLLLIHFLPVSHENLSWYSFSFSVQQAKRNHWMSSCEQWIRKCLKSFICGVKTGNEAKKLDFTPWHLTFPLPCNHVSNN